MSGSRPLEYDLKGMSLPAWLVASMLVATLALLVGAAVWAWRTAQVPFLGVFVEPTLVVSDVGDSRWPARAAGLANPDLLLALDGQPLEDSYALMRALAQRQPGDRVLLTARSEDGSTRVFPLQLTALAENRLALLYFFLPYTLALIYWGLGAWVFVARRYERAGVTFALLCAVIALSVGLLFDLYTSHRFSRVWSAALSLVGSVLIHLALVFPQQPRFVHRTPALRYLAYLPGLVIAVLNQWTVLDMDHPTAYFATWRAAFLFSSCGTFFFLAMMVYRGFRSESPIAQGQARVILLGSLLSFGPVAVWFFYIVFREPVGAPAFLLVLPWLVFFPISIAYAILRYRLFNVTLVVFSRTLAYVLMSAAVVGVYYLVLSALGEIAGVTLRASDPIPLGVVLLLTLLLNPLWTRLGRAVDHALLGRAADRSRITRQFTVRLAETMGWSSVLQALRETVEEGWRLQFAALFLYDPRRARYVPHPIGSGACPPVSFAREGPLAHQMLKRRQSMYLYRDRPIPADLMVESEALEMLRPALFVPVPGHGWLTLGPKQDGAPFSSDDLADLEALGSNVAVGLEKARLFDDLERRMIEVDVLRWVGQAINFTMDVDDLMELVYAQTCRVIDADNFYIALYNREKGTLSFAFYVEEGERLYPDDEWPAEMGLTGEIIRTGRAIVTQDYNQECLRRGISPGGRPGRAWMGVPLHAGDQVIGVMNVSDSDPAVSYSEEQVKIFSAIADQAAAILDKARLYREMEERARQLAALNEVGGAITSTLDLQAVLNLIMDKAVELLQAEAGSLVMVDQETGELVFEVTAGPGSAKLAGVRLLPGTGVVGRVVEEGKPLIVRDAHSDQRWFRDLNPDFVTRSIIAVPMVSRGRAIGVIELINRRDGVPFDEDDERLLTAFAADAAAAVENARLFTQTDQALAARVEELSMMQRIDRELNATLDYQQVMETTMDWALRTTGADMGLVAVVVEEESKPLGLRFLAVRGYPDSVVALQKEGELWPLDRGIIGRVARSGKPELVEHVQDDPDYQIGAPGMAAQLTVPIRREERIVGVIALESGREGHFTQETLEFVMRLADHAAIAIENAQLFQQVRRANDAKTEFVSFVSHELKQPMTAMKGYTELLIKGVAGELNEMQRTLLETVRANVDRMDSLVAELLDISRIESGRMRLEISAVSLGEVIEEAQRAIRAQVEAKRQTLEVAVPPDLPPVRGDRARLLQVLANLISNAYKYTPEGGRISVQARQWSESGGGEEKPFVLCSVSDTGIGMSPEDQARLFTKYFRADNPAVRNVPGTGLGLAITKSLVELHGGRIWVESKEGEGSTFSFIVPVASPTDAARSS